MEMFRVMCIRIRITQVHRLQNFILFNRVEKLQCKAQFLKLFFFAIKIYKNILLTMYASF